MQREAAPKKTKSQRELPKNQHKQGQAVTKTLKNHTVQILCKFDRQIYDEMHLPHEECRCAKEISTALKLLISSAQERSIDMQVHVASLDLKQAFHNVSPPLLRKAMKGFSTHPTLATTPCCVSSSKPCFQQTRTEGIELNKSVM